MDSRFFHFCCPYFITTSFYGTGILSFVINCKHHAIKCTRRQYGADLVIPVVPSYALLHFPIKSFLWMHYYSCATERQTYPPLKPPKIISNAISFNHFVTICWSDSDVLAHFPYPAAAPRQQQNGLKTTFCVRIQQRNDSDWSEFKSSTLSVLPCTGEGGG